MTKCKVCNYQTKKIIDFGKMPIANGFINKPNDKEYFFNLSLSFCPHCFMVQLADTVKPEKMFNKNYQYISSISNVMERHFKKMSDEIFKKVKNSKKPFIVELGCNDGIMLKHLAKRKINHLGIEPSGNVAKLAKKNGVHVAEKFFNKKTANEIVKKYGQADIICGANVFCHIENINSVFEGVKILLKDDGLLFFEEPYILDIIKKISFDQIYDEHVYYYSGLSISELAKKHGLVLYNMKPLYYHGGSMRYYLKKYGTQNIKIKKYLSEEKKYHLNNIKGYILFKKNVKKISFNLKKTLEKINKKGLKVLGYGATSKSTTLLNFSKIGPNLIDFICDNTPNKINKFTPGMHIPVKKHDQFLKVNPKYTLLLAWNHQKEIFQKEKKYRKNGGKFITFFPEINIQ